MKVIRTDGSAIRQIVLNAPAEDQQRWVLELLQESLAQAAAIHVALYGTDWDGASLSNPFIHAAESAWEDEARAKGWRGYSE